MAPVMASTTRTSLGLLGFLVASLTALASTGCGGSVAGVGGHTDGGTGDDETDSGVNPECPAISQVNGGAACDVSGLTCPTGQLAPNCGGPSRNLQCFCDGESWTCEHAVAPPCTPPQCPAPAQVFPGAACSADLGTCSSSNLPVIDCKGTVTGSTGTGSCTCTPNGWSCPEEEELPACSPVCPVPSSVVPGGACGPIGESCTSTNVAQMNCNGNGPPTTNASCTCTSQGWSCAQATPACVPPAQCPDPAGVRSYGYCTAPGLTCPGNPQYCGGDIYYDAVQCDPYNRYWVPIATTVCEVGQPNLADGGPFDDASIYN
jgi:hypothetical protein